MNCIEEIRMWLMLRLWKFKFIRKHWCWGGAVEWIYFGGWPFRRVVAACDYCGNCKDKDGEG